MTSSQPYNSSALIRLESMDLESIVAGSSAHNHLIDLSHLDLIQVSGDDAQSFLQRQFSNDLKTLGRQHCQLHSYCNRKGRSLAVVRLIANDQTNKQANNENEGKRKEFWMIVPKDISNSLIRRLKMFVMRSKVTIEPDSGYVLLGMTGAMSGEKVQEIIGQSRQDSGCFCYRVDAIVPRHLIIADSNHSIIKSIPRLHCDFWRWLDIRSGIPQIYAKTVETFIPQSINLELVDGISFRKGCFPGQEIIARIKHLGHPKQRLIIATVASNHNIAPGDAIYSRVSQSQAVQSQAVQKSGMVVDAVKTADNQFQLSAMVPAGMVEAGDLMIGSVTGAKLKRIALPYEIP